MLIQVFRHCGTTSGQGAVVTGGDGLVEEGFGIGMPDDDSTGTLELVTGLTGVEDEAGTFGTGMLELGLPGTGTLEVVVTGTIGVDGEGEHDPAEPPYEHEISGIGMLELGTFGTGTLGLLVVTGTTGVEEERIGEHPAPPEAPLP
jgi:hypothetical protein